MKIMYKLHEKTSCLGATDLTGSGEKKEQTAWMLITELQDSDPTLSELPSAAMPCGIS